MFLSCRGQGDLVGQVPGDHHNALVVTDQDVAGEHRHSAAGDRQLGIDRVVDRLVGGRVWRAGVGGDVHLGDGRRIAKAAVGDDPGSTSGDHASGQDVAHCPGPLVTSRVDHQHVSWPHRFDRQSLGVLRIVEDQVVVEIFSGGQVPQRVGLADHATARRQGPRTGDEHVPEVVLGQDGCQGGGAGLLEQFPRRLVYRCKWLVRWIIHRSPRSCLDLMTPTIIRRETKATEARGGVGVGWWASQAQPRRSGCA